MSQTPSPGAAAPASAGAAPYRLPLTSADPFAERVAALGRLFPEAQSDGRPDVAKLGAALGEATAVGPERYGLSWAGKSDALKTLRQLTTATLLPAPSESVNWDATGHAIIEGDNLEVLKVLQHAYHGKVKLIYIDPPYNTGGDFIYPDDYSEGLASYLQFTRQVNEEGVKLTTNVNTSGRYHSRWLTMIYPRLFLARNLLREDGVIFVSIDDHEVHNLRLVMDEIFGEENFVANIAWKHTQQSKNDEIYFSRHHNQILVYRRSGSLPPFLFARTSDDNKAYANPDNDPKGDWRSGDVRSPNFRATLRYDLRTPSGKIIHPPENGWRWSPETMAGKIATGEVVFSSDETRIVRKIYLEEQVGRTPENVWLPDFAGTTRIANAELKELFEDVPFDTVKPTQLITRMLMLGAREHDALVLDFFAGSGTTAQAVLELNKADGGNRKFILVQLPEPTGRKDFPTIAEITKERVRRVIRKLTMEGAESTEAEQGNLGLEQPAASKPQDRGFKVFKLAPSNFSVWDPALAPSDPEQLAKQWELTADNVRGDASEQALLHELLLKSGLPLTTPVETGTAAGLPVYRLDGGKLLVCLSRELTRDALRAMIELKPQAVLCLDVGFKGNDALKVNAQLEFQSHEIQFRTA